MTEYIFRGIELLPGSVRPKQLFILLHGVGTNSSDMVPLANQLRTVYPDAAFLIPEGTFPFDGGGEGRQWFSLSGLTEENSPARITEAMQPLFTLVRHAQDRLTVLPPDTALVGFSQGAMMALEFSAAHDGRVGRVLAFSGRYAKLPEKAPELTTVHLFHGENDNIIPVEHAYEAYERLLELQGDVTVDIAPSVGHGIDASLAGSAIHRLQTCVPLRSWKQALV
ncbi:MAG: esterase [Betaproteobacteria bacterium]|nr:esterase [Betaproteobacteria bacterium]